MAKKKKGAEEEGAKKSNKTKMIIVAVVIAAAGYKFVLAPKPAPKANGTAVSAQKIQEGEVTPLPDLTLNLADPGTSRYLRVGLALILEKGTTAESMKNELPIASDVAVDVLSSKTYAELNAPGAKDTIKAELSEKVRKAYDDKKVARVIFTSFVMQ
ncbi:MAG TPA: flagellar basal body-associated FliL family protein [Acidimicrobiales bacterium]|nr:flagellar basal body-associated FliL family protein [Acidimicrobiales bacterium]